MSHSSLFVSQEKVDALSRYATLALTSPVKEERDSAASQLRFLSSFDSWELVKQMLPAIQSNHLRFILCKSILFIVSNEIGPEERAETLEFMLQFLQLCAERGEELPRFVRVSVYSILACAFHSNWKFSVLSCNDDGDKPSDVREQENSIYQFLSKLESCLPPLFVLECLTEFVNYFTRQASRQSIYSVNRQSSRVLLPMVLNLTVKMLPQHPASALELSCLIIQSVPDKDGDITGLPSSSNIIFVEEWLHWATPVQSLLVFCFQAFTSGASDDVLRNAGQLMQVCACIESSSPDFSQMSYAFSENFLGLADFLIQDSIKRSGSGGGVYSEENLLLAMSLISNVLERAKEQVGRFLEMAPARLSAWSEHFLSVLQAFDMEFEDLHKAILSFYYTLSRSLLPDKTAPTRRDLYASLTAVERKKTTSPPAPPYITPAALSEALTLQIQAIFRAQLANVVYFAHLKEDSLEVRSDIGVLLHNERMLQPLAELLFCEQANLIPIVEEKLEEIMAFYRRFQTMRDKIAVASSDSQSFSWNAEEQQALLCFAEFQHRVFFPELGGGGLPAPYEISGNILICLSRLSVVISIFAIAIATGRVPSSESVLQYISSFAGPLLSNDESLTETLLENFTLDNADQATGVSQWRGGARQLHYGILRSLFFFCNCIFSSSASAQRHELFYEITLSLLRFVYLYHSDEPALVHDANLLLMRSMSHIPSARMFLGSDKMMAVLHAVKDRRIALLEGNAALTRDTFGSFGSPSAGQQGNDDTSRCEEVRRARSSFLTAITVFIETRFYSGYSVFAVLEDMVSQEVQPEKLKQFPLDCMENLLAIISGCRQPDTFQTVMDVTLDHSPAVSSAIRRLLTSGNSDAAGVIVRWCAKVSGLASQLVSDNGMGFFTYELAHFVLNSLVTYFQFLSSASQQGAELDQAQHQLVFRQGIAEVEAVYHAFRVLGNICGAEWCKLGVVVHYERQTVELFFVGLMQLILSTSAEMLMSSTGDRQMIFKGLSDALDNTGDTLDYIFSAFLRQGLWERLLVHLVKCLGYAFCPTLLALVYAMLRKHGRESPFQALHADSITSVGGATLREIFREVVFLVVVTPYLEIRDLHHIFSILAHCFRYAPEQCTKLMSDLLDFCSAYHRVRLRCIQSMLIQGRDDMVVSYISVFGQSSKVGVLAPW